MITLIGRLMNLGGRKSLRGLVRGKMAAGQENQTHVRGAVNPVQTEVPLMTGGSMEGKAPEKAKRAAKRMAYLTLKGWRARGEPDR